VKNWGSSIASRPTRIVFLNGVPRSGKSTLAQLFIESAAVNDAVNWLHFGVDEWLENYSDLPRPGIGLRPGGERPDLEVELSRSFEAFFRKILDLAQSAPVLVDSSIHRQYSNPLNPWEIACEVFGANPFTRIHLQCPVEEIRRRYEQSGRQVAPNGPGVLGDPLERWRDAILASCEYQFTLDSGSTPPNELCTCLAKFLQSIE